MGSDKEQLKTNTINAEREKQGTEGV